MRSRGGLPLSLAERLKPVRMFRLASSTSSSRRIVVIIAGHASGRCVVGHFAFLAGGVDRATSRKERAW